MEDIGALVAAKQPKSNKNKSQGNQKALIIVSRLISKEPDMTQVLNFKKITNTVIQCLSLTLIVMFAAGCLPTEPPSNFSPRPGTYASDQLVTINIPQADQIFYTLDDTEPADNCLEYTGAPILIDKPTRIRVMYIDNGVEHQVTENGFFNITNGSGAGSGGSGNETNRALLLDWLDHEYALRLLLQHHNNCGREVQQAGACDNGDFGVAGLNRLWWICDNYDPQTGTGFTDGSFTSHEGAKNGSLAQCKADGHGWATWIVKADGSSTFNYSNFALGQAMLDSLPLAPTPLHPLPSGANSVTSGSLAMTVTGKLVGEFGIDGLGNGTTRSLEFDHYGDGSDTSPHIKVSGSYSGYIEDTITFALKSKSGGSYTVFCTDAQCDTEPAIYLAPDWTKYVASATASCQAPWFAIETQRYNDPKCLQAPADGQSAFLQMTQCASMEMRQQWTFADVTPNDSGDNIWTASPLSDPGKCITRWTDPNPLSLNKHWFHVTDCDLGFNDANQHLNIIGTQKNVNIRLHGTNLCAENFWAPHNHLNLRDCDYGGAALNTQHHAFYQEGAFPQVGNPLSVLQNQ
jgi:hypothetical protein